MPNGLMNDNPSPFWGEGSGYGKRLTKWIGLDDLAAGIPGASDWQDATPAPPTYLADMPDWTGTPAPLETPAPEVWAPDAGALYDAGLPALGAAEMQPAELPKPPTEVWDFDPAPAYGADQPSGPAGLPGPAKQAWNFDPAAVYGADQPSGPTGPAEQAWDFDPAAAYAAGQPSQNSAASTFSGHDPAALPGLEKAATPSAAAAVEKDPYGQHVAQLFDLADADGLSSRHLADLEIEDGRTATMLRLYAQGGKNTREVLRRINAGSATTPGGGPAEPWTGHESAYSAEAAPPASGGPLPGTEAAPRTPENRPEAKIGYEVMGLEDPISYHEAVKREQRGELAPGTQFHNGNKVYEVKEGKLPEVVGDWAGPATPSPMDGEPRRKSDLSQGMPSGRHYGKNVDEHGGGSDAEYLNKLEEIRAQRETELMAANAFGPEPAEFVDDPGRVYEYMGQKFVRYRDGTLRPMSMVEAEARAPDRVADGALGYSVDQAQRQFGHAIQVAEDFFGTGTALGREMVERQNRDIAEGGYFDPYPGALLDQENPLQMAGWIFEGIMKNSVSAAPAVVGSAAAIITAPASIPLALGITGATSALGGIMSVGEVAEEMKEMDVYKPGVALAGGLAISVLDRVGAGRLVPMDAVTKLAKIGFKKDVAQQLSAKVAEFGLNREVVKDVLDEASTSSVQELFKMGAAAYAGAEYEGAKVFKRLGSAAAQGAAMGRLEGASKSGANAVVGGSNPE